jgi:hypothetical protein
MSILLEGRRVAGMNQLWDQWNAPRSDRPAGALPTLHIPHHPDDLDSHYDLTISHHAIDQVAFTAFDRWLAEAAGNWGLSAALLHDGIVDEVLRRLESGRLTIGFHLDYFALWHVAGDPYARLAHAVEDAGGRSVNPPARSRLFTDKATAHAELARRGLGVPATIVLRPWTCDRALTAAERSLLRLDEPEAEVYLKPANGFGGRGVVVTNRVDPEGLAAELAAARNHDRGDAFLVQRAIRCPNLTGDDGRDRPAYWRVLYCLGELIPYWWQKAASGPSYRRLSTLEIAQHHLQPVLDYALELAELTGLEWFSTELCLSEGDEPSRFQVSGQRPYPVVAIDYVNDQCDVDVQSRWPGAPPDTVVRYVAERLAEAAGSLRHAGVRCNSGSRCTRAA